MTQVAIPKAIYPSPLEDQHIYQTSVKSDPTLLTPLYRKAPRSKQPSGAFKLFKIKRSKKNQLDFELIEEPDCQ